MPIRKVPGVGPAPFKSSDNFSTAPEVIAVAPSSGRASGGESVTITGKNFRYTGDGTAPTVLFGSSPATNVVVVSATEITCDTPSNGQTELVSVSVTVGSQTATLVNGFTFLGSEIVSLTPNFGSFGGGTTVLVTGYNFVSGSAVFFDGEAATDVTFYDDQHISCVTPNHAVGAVDVTVEEPGGFVATLRNGFRYTLFTRGEDIRRQPGISIQEALNNSPNSCSFSVDGQSNEPIVGEKIEITDSEDGDRLLFAGNVQSVNQEYEGQIDQLVWRVTASDFTGLFNRKRPFGRYDNVSATDIVIDLVTRFAPGFGTGYIQTKLAKLTAIFDGTEDLATALSQVAEGIGGGHWYIDYEQNVHFFHSTPPLVPLPSFPNTEVGFSSGAPATPMTVVSGGLIPSSSSHSPGFTALQMTYVYDNGIESSLGPLSDFVALEGNEAFDISDIPIGPSVGSHDVVKRRIYFLFQGASGYTRLGRFCEINDNVTTAFTTWFGAEGASVATVQSIDSSLPKPQLPRVPPPPGGLMPQAELDPDETALFSPQAPLDDFAPLSFTPGNYALKVTFVYRDGTESLPTPASPAVDAEAGDVGFRMWNIPIGPDINSVDVIARRVYGGWGARGNRSRTLAQVIALLEQAQEDGNLAEYVGITDAATWGSAAIPTTYQALANAFGYGDINNLLAGDTFTEQPDFSPDRTSHWYLIPDNTTTEVVVQPGTGGPDLPGAFDPDDSIPQWPNPDGPNPEDALPQPGIVSDDNPDLLRDPQFTRSIDRSQLRNRIYVRGAGTTTESAVAVGATSIPVTDTSYFNEGGGEIISGYQRVTYTGLSQPSGVGQLILKAPLGFSLDQGAPINLWFQADDEGAQAYLAQIELDKDGNPTDGVHEYTIADPSITNLFQLYMRAYAELELFAWPVERITYSTRDPNSHPGRIVSVDMTNPPCQGDFLIQTVTLDQIHDESDQLLPRYNVTASSVKFDLEDLLLQIFRGKIGNGISISGVIPSVAERIPAQPDLSAVPRTTTKWWGGMMLNLSSFGTGGGPATLNVPQGQIAYATSGGTKTGVTDDDGYWVRTTVNINTNSYVRFGNAAGWTYLANFPLAKYRMRTGANFDDGRQWIGLVDAQWTDAEDQSARSGIGLRYNPEDGDTGWTLWTSNGVAQVVGAVPFAPYIAEAIQEVTIEVISTLLFTVTIGASSVTGNLPGIGTTELWWSHAFNNGATETRYWDHSAVWCERT